MVKNQKKPTVLSMGGVVPRRSRPPQVSKDATKHSKITPISTVRIKNTVEKKKRRTKVNASSWLISLRNNSLLLAISVFIAGLYLFDINHFPPILNSQPHFDSTSDIDSIEYLPMKLTLLAMSKLHISFSADARALSAIIMFFSLFCFYKLITTWVSRRMAALSVLLYSCSSWALFQTRGGGFSVMMLAMVPILLYMGSLLVNSRSNLGKFILSIIFIQFIFVPGAIWFFLAAAIISFIYFRKDISLKSFWLASLVMFMVLAGYAVLILQLSLDSSSQFIKLAGLDAGSMPSLSNIWSNISSLPNQLFVSGVSDGSIWLKFTPIIDWVSLLFMLTGLIYLASSKIHPARKKIIFMFLLLALALIFINGFMYISILLPILYLAVAAGITYLLDQWMDIFPSNPLPRAVGLAIMCVIVLLVCGFHIERYFIGWPKTDEYHQIFKD